MNLYLSHSNLSNAKENDSPELLLWQKVTSGDRKAFSDIYKKYVKILYQYGMKLSQDKLLVEDNIHDLFVDLWNKKNHIEITSSLRFYLISSFRRRLFRVITNTRKKIPESLHNFEFQCESREDVIINENENAALKKRVQNALKKLTKRQREVIYLRFFQGLEYEEIASIMEISVDSIYVLTSKSIKSLKEILPYIILLIGLFYCFS
ncbi:RNA polymerase sigma factor [Fulvivirga ligni]|uniref:RNA polymerase sigma factor n=1 Tax=Fulvivirga ligni TaxID=2904246 RepID=UPI001F429137|nr:sigma-70 family RNA polymerase sigma factor [Fulvivirga ligni]UII24173.1 sigma-70 family RNA polymerase sigma factor [Fulvivirga ligni]